MATVTVTVPDTEVDLFLKELTTLSTRVIKADRLSPAIEAHNAKRAQFMGITNLIGEN